MRNGQSREVEELITDGTLEGERYQICADLNKALAKLPTKSRAGCSGCMMQHDAESYTYAEIAEMMQMDVSFSKSQLVRAHDKLKHQLSSTIGDKTCILLLNNY